MKLMRLSVAGGACVMSAASWAMAQVSVVVVPVTTISQGETRVLDGNSSCTLALLERAIPLQPPSNRNREYSVVRPDGSNAVIWGSVDWNPPGAVSDLGDAVYGHSTTMSSMLRVTGMTEVENLGALGWVFDVSADERFIVGKRYTNGHYVPVRWDRQTQSAPVQLGGTPGQPYGEAYATTDDGAFACGYTDNLASSAMVDPLATVWDAAGTARALPLPAGRVSSIAAYVDRFGGAVGWSASADNFDPRPTQWPAGGGARLLPIVGVRGYVTGVSANGRVVTGYDMAPAMESSVVWIDGVRHVLHEYLAAHGATGLEGWGLYYEVRVSRDGQRVCGVGYDNAGGCMVYFATLPAVCAADMGKAGGLYGGDGALDNNDFIAFIGEYFAGNAPADVGSAGGQAGGDGLLDNDDFIAFISAFFAGC
jgi:hypothetical protein